MKYIVSHQYKFVYFVVPKAACSSIKTALIPLFGLNTDNEDYWYINRRGERVLRVHKLYDDSPHQITRARLDETWDRQLRSYYGFAFVRNPWDRLVSCWHHKFRDPFVAVGSLDRAPLTCPPERPNLFLLDMTFEQFVHAVCTVPDEEADIHFRSQWTILQSAKAPERLLPGFLGHLENLEEDFSKVVSAVGCQDKIELPHSMKSHSRGTNRYRDYYSEELRRMVAERFARDVREFGYAF